VALCIRHGGGKRCHQEGCKSGAECGTNYCMRHGGGKRCMKEGCTKGAERPTKFCCQHGGGRRCKIEGCNKHVQKKQLCRAHYNSIHWPNAKQKPSTSFVSTSNSHVFSASSGDTAEVSV